MLLTAAPVVVGLWMAVLLAAYWLREVFTPLLVAALLAFIFNPVITRMQRAGVPRVAGIAGLFGLLLVPLLVLAYFAGPGIMRELGRESNGLAAMVQDFKERLHDYLSQFSHLPSWIVGEPDPGGPLGTRTPDAGREAGTSGGGAGTDLLTGWTGLLQTLLGFLVAKGWLGVLTTGTLLTGFYLFFLLLHWNDVATAAGSHVPRPIRPAALRAGRRMDRLMAGLFRGRVPVMIAVGVLTAAGLQSVGAGFAMLIGVLTGVASLVPVMPMVVGFLPSCVSAYLSTPESANPWSAAAAAAGIFLSVQFLAAKVLTPLLQGPHRGLHPVIVVPALLVGAQLGDAFGVLVSLPTACLLQVVFREFVLPPLRSWAARRDGRRLRVRRADRVAVPHVTDAGGGSAAVASPTSVTTAGVAGTAVALPSGSMRDRAAGQ